MEPKPMHLLTDAELEERIRLVEIHLLIAIIEHAISNPHYPAN